MAVEPPPEFRKNWLDYIPLITSAELERHIASISHSNHAGTNAKWLLEQLKLEQVRRSL
jgi:hypothetical protein